MATAKKLPSGRWRVQLYIGTDDSGKRRYKSFTADTKKEAEYLAAEYNLKRKEKPHGLTVGEAIDGYISSKEHVLSPTTIHGYREIRRNKLQSLMDISLDKLTNLAVQQEVNREALRLSPKTLRNAHGLLSAALAMYMPDFVLRTTLPAKRPKVKDLPTPQEVVDAVRGSDVELPVMLALWLGLRMSEVRGIRYGDIQDGVITVQHTRVEMDGQIEKDSTKTATSTRRLRIPPYISDMIGDGDPGEYVVKMAACTIYQHFVKLIADSTGKKMTFHDLRHLNASVMLALGVPDKYAMERGGWSTTSTLKAVYQHTFSDEREAVDSRIDAYFETVCNTKCNTHPEK